MTTTPPTVQPGDDGDAGAGQPVEDAAPVVTLAGLDLVAGATPAQLDTLQSRLAPIGFAEGEVLIEEGDVGRFFVLVLDGDVTVTRRTRVGDRELGRGGRGAIFTRPRDA